MKKTPSDKILMLLKMRGQVTAQSIAEELSITKEGARKHLVNLAGDNLIKSTAVSEGVGRPSTYYSLTDKGLSNFPDTHAEITVQLLQSIKKLLGENALDLLINDREANVYSKYEKATQKTNSIEEKLSVVVKKRTEEGYMAEWKKEGKDYLLIENHCPICAAATQCQGFCKSELKNFQQLFGEKFSVERKQHIVSGGDRCTYLIKEI
ncbi:HTH domain-containing protein [Flavobacterium rakeshii]|uniref:HTH domain-containing protein n=1 Tax=Flavobacterium rakeshii TaxID=1038845 RepID=A0A6N8HDM0_9FLAO|nr:metalloregulator ArsR/SmtB family transcription factor [Flavobacterium rakeshii]MUV03825.1 HTH domain-containing protein [Flavobacterium rakeshii]